MEVYAGKGIAWGACSVGGDMLFWWLFNTLQWKSAVRGGEHPLRVPRLHTDEILSSQITPLLRPMPSPGTKPTRFGVPSLCGRGNAGLMAGAFGVFKRAQSKGMKNKWVSTTVNTTTQRDELIGNKWVWRQPNSYQWLAVDSFLNTISWTGRPQRSLTWDFPPLCAWLSFIQGEEIWRENDSWRRNPPGTASFTQFTLKSL